MTAVLKIVIWALRILWRPMCPMPTANPLCRRVELDARVCVCFVFVSGFTPSYANSTHEFYGSDSQK